MHRITAPHLTRRCSRGGTLLGFMLGLLVGIGAALAVAIYVTKVPIPLVDRGVQRKPTQPETEAERLKSWNPNAGLSSVKPAVPLPADGQATPAAPGSASAPDGSSAPVPSADPIAELIRQRAAPAPAAGELDASSAAPNPFIYYVQAGAFRTVEDAEAQRARLALLGFDAKISEREQADQRVYRVRIGPFADKVKAEVMQEQLRAARIDSTLVRAQR